MRKLRMGKKQTTETQTDVEQNTTTDKNTKGKQVRKVTGKRQANKGQVNQDNSQQKKRRSTASNKKTNASKTNVRRKQSTKNTGKQQTKNRYNSIKTRGKGLFFNKVSGASARADFEVDKFRYYFLWFMACGLFVILFMRAFYLQVVNADMYQEKGDKFITSKRTIPTYRGMIIDRNGLPLAVSAPLSTVIFDPLAYAEEYYSVKRKIALLAQNPKASNKQKTRLEKRLKALDLTQLATAANVDVNKLKKVANINDNVDVLDKKAIELALPKGAGSRYFPLMSKVQPEIADQLMALDFFAVSKRDFYQRYYPQAYPSSQLLGFMGQNAKDPNGGYQGRAGLERQYQETLAGIDGEVMMLRDARRTGLKEIEQLKQEKAGENIQLTIDSRLQFLLYQELEKVGREQKAFWSSGMVVDVNTGEVLAMATWPSYNANNLNEMTGENQRNRPISDSFEPGSVMKPFTVAAALESGKYSEHSTIDTSPGYIRVKGYTIRDHANLGRIGFTGLLHHSSNVASTKIALSLPPNAISDMQRKFGFGQKTALDLSGEQAGKVVTPKEKQKARRATISYGYGLQVTLAQLTKAYATLASGGVMHPLSVVKTNLNQPTNTTQSKQQPETQQIISREHALSIVEMMESVTKKGGTAPAAAIDGYRVAGKTGTSRRVNPEGGYYSDKYRTVFAGIAPVSNPRFVVAILVENPQKNKYAGEVSAPVFHNVMKEVLRLYNVPLDKPLKGTEKH